MNFNTDLDLDLDLSTFDADLALNLELNLEVDLPPGRHTPQPTHSIPHWSDYVQHEYRTTGPVRVRSVAEVVAMMLERIGVGSFDRPRGASAAAAPTGRWFYYCTIIVRARLRTCHTTRTYVLHYVRQMRAAQLERMDVQMFRSAF